MKDHSRCVCLVVLCAVAMSLLGGTVSAKEPAPDLEPEPETASPLTSDYAGRAWRIETVDYESGTGGFASLAVSLATNYPHISYYAMLGHDLKYAELTPSGWDIRTLDDGGPGNADVGGYTSIGLDWANEPHIAYYDYTNKDLKYVFRNGGYWSEPQTLASSGSVGTHTDITFSWAGLPIISYFDETHGYPCYARKHSDGTWWHECYWYYGSAMAGGFTQILPQQDDWPAPGILPIVAFYVDNSDDAEFWWQEGEGIVPGYWCSPSNGGLGTDYGQYLSMDLDSANHLVFSYYDSVNGCLMYSATTAASICDYTQLTVDCEGGNVGKYTSLVQFIGTSPRISYYDVNNGRLKFAYWSGVDWTTEVIDDSGDVGQYSSMDTDGMGLTHIAYYSVSGAHLKYAHQVLVWQVFVPVVTKDW